jgi:XTP/dITP diphosphohydrolase
MKLLVATGNQGKIKEITHEVQAAGLGAADRLTVLGLADLPPGFPDVVEDRPTFLGNATKKARHFAAVSGLLTLADDSGLCVEALGGGPGVLSARYAGEPCDNQANNDKLLREMADIPDERRQAKFVCAMALAAPLPRTDAVAEAPLDQRAVDLATVLDDVHGQILRAPRGTHGFGYDPLFFHPSSGCTTAELPMEEKSRLSHRGKALRRLIAWMLGHWQQLAELESRHGL